MKNSLDTFHRLVAQWFSAEVGSPTAIQALAWEAIIRGEHILMTAPTGSGKTMAAFLWALNQLIIGTWTPGCTRVVYVSPLKALNNDIRRNLLGPLQGLRRLFEQNGQPFPEIQVVTRSGDTTQSERRRMLRRPPEILVTTPESLNLMLSSASGRASLTTLKTAILDEIHAIMGGRRGTFLMTAVERLTRLSGEFQRIALSATVKPLETAAGFVGGFTMQGAMDAPGYRPRSVRTLSAPGGKTYVLNIRQPKAADQIRDPKDYWNAFADCVKAHVQANQSTLVFTNSRKLCEKMTFLMNRDEPELLAYSHHGSLSRQIRTEVEKKLKAGILKAIVATGSLELGIDIGTLDEVILVQSPASVAEAMQRVGRAGHGVGQRSHGTFYPSHAMDVVCAAVLVRAITEESIEAVQSISAPLDVLAQIIVSMCAFETWHPLDLFNFIRTAQSYQTLTRRQFDLVLNLLEGRFEQTRIRELQPRLSFDRTDQTLRTRKGALLALYTSGGVIPDRGHYLLRHGDSGAKIGELDEEFVWEARIGQVFTLGTQNWRIQKITHSDVLVLPAPAGRPAPPFWRAEDNSRGFHLSEKIGQFLEMAEARLAEPGFEAMLRQDYSMDANAAERLASFLQRQRSHTNCALPHRHHVLMEYTTLGAGGSAGRQVVWHTLWGGRINRPLAVAMEAAWEERFGSAQQIFASNDAVSFILPHDLAAEEMVHLVEADQIERLIQRRLAQTGFFGARFRECAGRALLLPRHRINMRMPLWLSRLRAQKLMAAVGSYEDFPILLETWRTCLQDEFDLPGLRRLLRDLANGQITWSGVQTAFPSPLAQNSAWQPVNAAMYQTDMGGPGQAGRVSPDLLYEITLEPGLRPRIDAKLAKEFESKRQRLIQGYAPDSPEELLDWVKERLALPLPEWQSLLEAVDRDHGPVAQDLIEPLAAKLVKIQYIGEEGKKNDGLVVAREMLPRWVAGFYESSLSRLDCKLLSGEAGEELFQDITAVREGEEEASTAAELLSEWLRFYGPRSFSSICRTLGISSAQLESLISELVETQTIITGELLLSGGLDLICDRENFEILLRLSRKAAAPVFEALDANFLPLFLALHQGLTQAGDSLDDLAQRLNHLMGWAAPAALWETDLLPARLTAYQTDWLDRLIQDSDLRWIGGPGGKVLFSFENEMDLILPEDDARQETNDHGRETAAESSLLPDAGGRYPFSMLQQHTGFGAAELNDKLWQAVWQGLVSNDTFSALRRGLETDFKMPDTSFHVPHNRRRPGRSAFQRWRGARPTIGNWLHLNYPDLTDDPIDREERNKERVRMLLERYGIVFRELLARELPMLRWGALFRSLRLMELSGEVLAGQFFSGIPGLQFVSAQAFRLMQGQLPKDAVFWLNAVDPASLCGLGLAPFQHQLPKRLPTSHLVYRGTELVLLSRQHARQLQINLPDNDPDLPNCFSFLTNLLSRPVLPLRRIVIETINDKPAANQNGYLDRLKSLFEVVVDPKGLCLFRKHSS